MTRADVIDEKPEEVPTSATANPAREKMMLAYYAVTAVLAVAVLAWATAQPHTTAAASEDESGPAVALTLAPGQSATANFPPAEVTKYRVVTHDTLSKVQAGDHTGATARIRDLKTTWDDAQSTLEPLDDAGWTVLDGQIDEALTAVRAAQPNPETEKSNTLHTADVTAVNR